MLPSRLVDYARTEDGRVVPRWLGARDDPWLRELAAEAAASAGRAVGAAEERLIETVAPMAYRHGAGRRTALAVWNVERRRWSTVVASPVPPARLRRTVFELAAERSREEALATAGATYDLEPSRIEELLFADRAHARILQPPETPSSPADLRERYNLALVQALLTRSVELTATVRGNLRSVVGYAKLLGLMALFDEAPDGATRMTVSGPLSLFHDTVKYGHALARWFPALTATPGWSLAARVVVGGEALDLDLDAGAPLPRVYSMPRAHDSKLEARLESDLRRLDTEWRIEREVAAVRAKGRLFFPDFALVAGARRVLVELAGWWTPDYVAGKLELLRAARVPLLLCIDARHASTHGDLATDERVILFDKRLDARILVAACERMLERPERT